MKQSSDLAPHTSGRYGRRGALSLTGFPARARGAMEEILPAPSSR